MATNEELLVLAEPGNLHKLYRSQRAVERRLKATQDELNVLHRQIDEARRVNEVLAGICLYVSYDNEGRWSEAWTAAQGDDINERVVYLYQKVKTVFWAVRINERVAWNRCTTHSQSIWHGDMALGLDKDWSYEEALTIAKQWLLSNGPLSAEERARLLNFPQR